MVKSGRFGEYVTDGEYNATLRKDDTVESITLERAAELLAERRERGPAKKAAKKGAKKTAGQEGRQEDDEEGREEVVTNGGEHRDRRRSACVLVALGMALTRPARACSSLVVPAAYEPAVGRAVRSVSLLGRGGAGSCST